MATGKSGNFDVTTSNANIAGRLYWSETYDTSTNKSSVTLTYKLRRTNSYSGSTTNGAVSSFTLWCNGVNKIISIAKNGKTIPSGGTEVTICENTFTGINHNSDGTATISVGVEGSLNSCGTAGNIKTNLQSKNITLTKIARASELSVSAVYMELDKPSTLTITRENSSFRDTISYSCGNVKDDVIAEKTASTSLSFTPPLLLASQNTTSSTVSITYKITTYNGDSVVGSQTISRAYKIPDTLVPAISSFTLSDAVGGIVARFEGYVNGKSKIRWDVSASGVQGSTIKSYLISIAGQSATTSTGTTDFIDVSQGTNYANVTVTDSRGRTATATASFEVFNYSAPVITTFNAQRTTNGVTPSDGGNILRLTINLRTSPVNNKNSVTYGMGYRIAGSTSAFTTMRTIPSNTYSFNSYIAYTLASDPKFSPDNAYEIRLLITDYFGETSKLTTIATDTTVFDVLGDGSGFCFGGVASKSNTLESKWKAEFPKSFTYTAETMSKTDYDNMTELGTYALTSIKSYLNFPTNAPASTSGVLEVLPGGTTTQRIQRITSCGTNHQIFERLYYGGSWHNWVEVGGLSQNGTFTIEPGWTLGRNYIAKNGSIVTMFARISVPSGVATGQDFRIATITNSAFRPSNSIATTGWMSSSSKEFPCVVWVNNSGEVHCRCQSDTSVTTYVEFSLTYDLNAVWNNT